MNKIKCLFATILVVFLTCVLTSCAFIKKSNDKIQIVTTLYPEYDMICKIIGNDKNAKRVFDVKMIIPPGQDVHNYDPSLKDLIIIKNADVFIYTSNELETWAKDLEFLSSTRVVDLSKTDGIVLEKVEEPTEEHDHEGSHHHEFDPHYWVYPVYSSLMLERIFDVLVSTLDGSYDELILQMTENLNKYKAELTKIDNSIKTIYDKAVDKTLYFGSPFSFYYWHVKYGFEYELVYSTCSTETEPSIDVLMGIINKMKNNDITCIFAKELVNQEACLTIKEHTNAEILILHSCHNVSIDDFNNKEVSFITIMKQNVLNLAKMLKVEYTMEDII